MMRASGGSRARVDEGATKMMLAAPISPRRVMVMYFLDATDVGVVMRRPRSRLRAVSVIMIAKSQQLGTPSQAIILAGMLATGVSIDGQRAFWPFSSADSPTWRLWTRRHRRAWGSGGWV
jgi:hypothetical protein